MTFARLFSEATIGAAPRSGDVLAVSLPLLRQIDELHRTGLVTGAAGISALDYDGERLRVRSRQSATEESNLPVVDRITADDHRSAVEINTRRTVDLTTNGPLGTTTSRDVIDPDDDRPTRPVFVRGYRVWEQLHGHHDQLTDIALAGLWLCSYAFALDLDAPDDLDTLAENFRRPGALNEVLHPVIAGTLAAMIHPDRSRRPTEVSQIIARLEHHRDLPADLDLSTAYLPDTDWRQAVLGTLRDRVFDTTRRNRELYYRRTSTSVSLTEASVPLMLNVERIQPGDLLTWTGSAAAAIGKGEVDLARWCRFEEAPYLAPALDKLISAERKTKVETGHGRLNLIIAFLRWYDPEAREAVESPLLTLPATLTRKKGIETRYRLDASHDDATVNPVLRHVFAKRFDIELPETVANDDIVAFVGQLERQVRLSAPAISIELIDKPRIDLLRRKARLRVDTYRRHRARSLATSGRWRRQEFSYEPDDWRPLGKGLYERFVRPAELPLRDLAGATPRPRPNTFNATDDDTPGSRSSETYTLGGDRPSVDRWQVDLCSVTLSMLGSRRTSLARDYDAVLVGGSIDVTSTPFEPLFDPDRPSARNGPTEPIDPGQILVLPADDAQARAVRRAVRGDSFIIQGPPGTGKSQTIANVIAALVAEGKRVLFVCEKRAAIDVVAHRLDQVGLGDLTALIHDSQLDKKQFIADLGATYHAWLESAAPLDARISEHHPAEQRRAELLEEIDVALRPVRELSGELGRSMGGGLSVAQAIERLATLEAMAGVGPRHEPDEPVAIEPGEWLTIRPRLDQVQDALASVGSGGPLGTIAALRVAPTALTGADAIATCRRLGETIDLATTGVDPSLLLTDLVETVDWTPLLAGAVRVGAIASLDPRTPQHLELHAAAQRQLELQQSAATAALVLERWTVPLSSEDTAAALAVAEAKEGSFLGFLSGRWRDVKALVEGAYRFDNHQVRPTVTAVLTELAAHHEAVAAVRATEQRNDATYGSRNAVALRELANTAQGRPAFTALMAAGTRFEEICHAFSSVAGLQPDLLLGPGATIADLRTIGQALARTPVSAEDALLSWSRLADAATGSLTAVLDAEATLPEIEARILRRELDHWITTVDSQRFSGSRIDEAVATTGGLLRQLLETNAAMIVERARTTFLDNISHSEASMARRSSEDKDRKKAYVAGRRIVEREAEKKARHRSIREMASGESQVVVRDLRPIWLMSPLSVSDTLPLETDLFDVVIFDEASQIPVEDAIPSVMRAPQVIVVGDRMQMPPTRFFSSDAEDENELLVDEDRHRRAITLDSDSFLTQAELALGSSMLNWHYRSRSESLIAYSNHAFYGGRLATVPDTALPAGALEELRADDTSDADANTAETLQRPISFHHLEHGRYRDRRNAAEADYIAEMVRVILGRDEGLTIGVVAFSEAQQDMIETALEELAAIDPEFAARHEAEVHRIDDGEFVGLFVKNLENVQGDERDLIIMSVCYGPDIDGRIRMNFGPINNAGGERRLNVIFSRAKQHMAVVTSLQGSQITNLHNEGASHLAGFLTYAAAESRGEVAASSAQLQALAPDPTQPAPGGSTIAASLAAELRGRGWTADTAVGRSIFRVDVAIAMDGSYRLGVLLEPDHDLGSDHVAPRYLAEASVLSAFGWPILRVPLSDWFIDPSRVIERIEAAARKASPNGSSIRG